MLYYIQFCHAANCLWIVLGGRDVGKEEDERLSWMFLPDTQFSKDPRPAYDQITDPESSENLKSVYVFSMIFIQQTLTTVGYGNTSYQTELEWIFVMLLEMVSIGLTSLLLITIWEIIKLRDRAFEEIVFTRMASFETWLLKTQICGRPLYLTRSLSLNIGKSIEESLFYDFNIIVEEFDLY